MVNFGWFVTINTLLTVLLEDPLIGGGRGFTPQRSAACMFTIVLFRVCQLIASGHVLPIGRPYRTELAGSAINDRLPPGIYKRRGGTVRPEYRLRIGGLPLPLIRRHGSHLRGHLNAVVRRTYEDARTLFWMFEHFERG